MTGFLAARESPMRVMYWTALYAPDIGGVEVVSTQLLRGLRRCGHDLCVVTSHGHLDLPDVVEHEGVAVHRFRFQTAIAKRDLEEIVQVRTGVAALKREFRPDLVHLNITEPSFLFHYQTAEAWPAPLLITLPVFVPATTATDSLLGRALRDAAWITAPSMAVLDEARRLVPGIEHRSSVLQNGLEVPAIRPSTLPFDQPRILAIGRLVEEKGFDTALAAFAKVLARFPRARLVLAGDGAVRVALERQAAELGISHAVDFLGWVAPADVPQLINTATMVLQPSRWREAFGLVALQGAQLARPVIASRVGGVPEVVVHRETGLLVEKENADRLAQAMLVLLNNPDLAARMGTAGRRRALTEFTIERHVFQFDTLYRQVATESAHAITR